MSTNVSISLTVIPSEGVTARISVSVAEHEFMYEFDF